MNKEENKDIIDSLEKKIEIGLEELQKTYKIKNSPIIQELRADLASNLGILYNENNDLEKSRRYLQLALVEYSQLKLDQKTAAVQGSLGAIHLENEEFRMALKFYEDAYNYWKNTNFLNERIICLQNLGIIHLNLKDESRASDYIFEALKKAISLQDEHLFAMSIEVLLNHYEKLQRYDMLYELKKKAFEFWQTLDIPDRKWKTLIDLGVICQILEDFDESLKYFKSAFNLAYDLSDLEKMFHAQGFIAEAYIKLKNIEKGKKTYIESFKIAVYLNTRMNFQQHVDEMRSSLMVLGVEQKLIAEEEKKALEASKSDNESS